MTDELFLLPLFDWRSAVASTHGPEKPTTRFVLLTLALHMSVKGDSCFPSIDLLAEESGLSRRAVIEHLQIAEATGWLAKKDRSVRSGQGWRRVEYFGLIPTGIEQILRTPKSNVVQDGHQLKGGDRHAEGGARDRKKVVTDGHPSTSVNTSRTSKGAFAPPDWIPMESWKAYEAMRAKIRKPMTDRARELTVKKLAGLKEQGQDPAAVLDQSIECSWTTIYPLKVNGANPGPTDGWWSSDAKILAKAKEIGVSTIGMTTNALKSKISEKLSQTRHH